MFKKFLLISILVISMTAVLFSEACAVTCSRCRSLCAEELLKGLGNVNKNVTYSNISIKPEVVTIPFWCNHGANCQQGPGNPFVFSLPSNVQLNYQTQIRVVAKNGTAMVNDYWPVCEMWDLVFCPAGHLTEGSCVLANPDGTCIQYGNVCPAEEPGPAGEPIPISYDYSIIPCEAYPSNGNCNWSPEPPNCDPNLFPLGSLDYHGDLIYNRMWVTSTKTVWTCDRDGNCVATETTVDKACLELAGDLVTYDRVPLTNCISYQP